MLRYILNGGDHCLNATATGSYLRGFESEAAVMEEIRLALSPLPQTVEVWADEDKIPTGYENAVVSQNTRSLMGYTIPTRIAIDGVDIDLSQAKGKGMKIKIHPRLDLELGVCQDVRLCIVHTHSDENWAWAAPRFLEVGTYKGFSYAKFTIPEGCMSPEDIKVFLM